MRAWIMSDLHLNVLPSKTDRMFTLPDPQPEHDVVVIAGDTREKLTKGIEWIASAGFQKPVIVVGGNHCFYRTSRDRELEKARELAVELSKEREHPIYLLQDDKLDLGGVRFIGCTLWTDYRLHGEHMQEMGMLACESGMTDHRLIRIAAHGYRRWLPRDALAEHERSRWLIEKRLKEPFDGPRVVVTHHAPSARSYSLRTYSPMDLLSCGWASHLDELVDCCDLWIHGHLHEVADYRVGDGRVICNPRGYEAVGQKTDWNPSLVVSIEKATSA